MKKTNLFARITALALVLLMVFGTVSCSKDASETDTGAQTDTDTATVSTDAADTGHVDTFNVPEVDYGGKAFNVLVRKGSEHYADMGANVDPDEGPTTKHTMVDRAEIGRAHV